MKYTKRILAPMSATGEATSITDKVLFALWLVVPAYQYSGLHVENSRVGFWGLSAILIFRYVIRDLYRGRFVLASRGLFFPMLLVLLWKFVELIRAPDNFNTAFLVFIDFCITYICCLMIAPRIFSPERWVIDFRRLNVLILGSAIILHPFIPVRTDMAGWDKGASWAFAHPNIAAMYPLVIYLLSLYIFGVKIKRRMDAFDIFCIGFSLLTLFLTNSRAALSVAFVVTLLMVYNLFTLKYFIDATDSESRAIRLSLKISAYIAIGWSTYYVYTALGRQSIDNMFSGRISFAADVLLSAKSLVLGVGLMPPGVNLVADSSARGAGIDGLYTNLIYGEGYVGFVIFVVAMYGFCRMAKADRRSSAYFGILLTSCLLFGVTETHFWLLASPLTALISVLASTLGTKAGSYTVVSVGAPLPTLPKGR